MKLITARLVLREYEERDCEAIYALDTDPAVLEMIGADTLFSREVYNSWFEANIAAQHDTLRTRYHFVITNHERDDLIGRCRLQITSRTKRTAEFGYRILPLHWNQGYATEATHELLRFAFVDLGLRRLTAHCRVGNPASARVLEKIGMQLEGRLRKEQWAHGTWEDTLQYALLEDEYAAHNRKDP